MTSPERRATLNTPETRIQSNRIGIKSSTSPNVARSRDAEHAATWLSPGRVTAALADTGLEGSRTMKAMSALLCASFLALVEVRGRADRRRGAAGRSRAGFRRTRRRDGPLRERKRGRDPRRARRVRDRLCGSGAHQRLPAVLPLRATATCGIPSMGSSITSTAPAGPTGHMPIFRRSSPLLARTPVKRDVGRWGDAENPSNDYDGGHMIGSQLGGWGGQANLVPQDANFNRGELGGAGEQDGHLRLAAQWTAALLHRRELTRTAARSSRTT